jgi:5'-3' exonuclease
MPRSVQADRDTSTSGFQLLHISLLREYFDFEYQ